MVSRMADGEHPQTKVEPSRRVALPASPIVDYGTAPLQLANGPDEATLVTEFIDDAAPARAASATLITEFIDDAGSAASGPAMPLRQGRSVRQICGTIFGFIGWLL